MGNIPRWLLEQRQAMPLEQKVELSKAKIKEWHEHWNGMVYVAFSGGKDSTVLLHIVREIYPDVPAVFFDTGLEYPELRDFVFSFDNVVAIKPEMNFRKVIEKYGYPVISKKNARFIRDLQNESERNYNVCRLRRTGLNRKDEYCPTMKLPDKWMYLVNAPFRISEQCCDVMKKTPAHRYNKSSGRKPIIGMMASDSNMREQVYLRNGCNFNGSTTQVSWPMAFWTSQDILNYILVNDLPIANVYGNIKRDEDGLFCTTGVRNTGCVFCAFGVHLEKEPNRFQMMKQTHPQLWNYCMDKLDMRMVLDYIGVPYE